MVVIKNKVRLNFVVMLNIFLKHCTRNFKTQIQIPLKTATHSYLLKNFMSTEHISKKMKTAPTIGTHDGQFHCDEILACFMLQQLPVYKNATIVRTRKDELLDTCDIVVDVGGIFDKDKNRFDHHQKSFQHTLKSLRPDVGHWEVRLSSAGLIYLHFGEQVIEEILKNKLNKQSLPTELLSDIFKKVYEYFVLEIDAIDNGVPMYEGEAVYRISTDLCSRVANFNQTWNSTADYNAMEQFEKAKEMVGMEFLDRVVYYATVWYPAKAIVENAIKNRFKLHESGQILQLDEICPWKDHLYSLEKQHDLVGIPKYVLFKNSDTDFRVMAVPKAPKSFICRKFLHKDWRGTRNEELIKISGITDANFCHATGFIGGSSSEKGSLEMAVKSLEGEYDD